MKIVQFKDGTYGIRRWSWFRFRFRFLVANRYYWWNISDALGTGLSIKYATLEEAVKLVDALTDKGKVVKV